MRGAAVRCVVYARYSTDRQTEASIVDQVRVCREYAASRGWTCAAVHTDDGISGAALGNRPGVQAALAAVDGADVLLVADLSRLSRSQDLAPLLARLRHRGARVIGVQDGFDSDARHARMQAGLSGIMSEEFRAMVSDRTRSALELRARSGRSTGGAAYEDREIVREIFARFAAGESMKTIASDLNQRDIPSPGAGWKPRARPRGRWLVPTLHAILHNERYIGHLIWNRSQWIKDPDTGKRLRRERPESEWIVQECEPLVDRETWRQAQARFSVHPGRGAKGRWLLSGILECALCGGKMTIIGGSQRRYVCGTHHAGGVHACANASSFPREVAERLILVPVVASLLSPGAVAEGLRLMREQQGAPPKADSPNREVLELERLVKTGVLSAETAAPSLAEARRKAEARCTHKPAAEMPSPTAKAWRDGVARMSEILEGDDITAAREALMGLIGPARCAPAENGFVRVQLPARDVLLATSTRGRPVRTRARSRGVHSARSSAPSI